MATNFPDSPSNGATHTFGGTTYTYNSTKGVWTAPAGNTLTGLTDTPANFSGAGGKTLKVNSGATAVEFVTVGAAGAGETPIIYTEPPTTHALNVDGSTSTVQMQAYDPEGTAITYGIAYANSTNARPSQLAADTTINQTTGTFTFDPSSTNSDAGSFKARLSASDGITSSTRFVNFNLTFNHTLHWLVIAGGGGGGSTLPAYANGGGGGAGGYRASWNNEASGGGGSAEAAIVGSPGNVYTITVGAGGNGASSSAVGTDGADSSLARTTGASMTTITSVGGGAGGFASGSAGRNGGSGGGANHYQGTAGTGTANQGYAGGTAGGAPYGGGGGGGAGGVGENQNSGDTVGGDGGVGVVSTITGSSVERAGGGGAASAGTASGGGGAGATSPGNGTAGTANTGGGGGAGGITGGQSVTGAAGGSGVVIIRTSIAAQSTTGSPTITTVGSDTVYQFNANGTITF
tara:strand:- start:271 stop:1656 length:1386 start_codon:yes stop_codon:yes gene_type:complete